MLTFLEDITELVPRCCRHSRAVMDFQSTDTGVTNSESDQLAWLRKCFWSNSFDRYRNAQEPEILNLGGMISD